MKVRVLTYLVLYHFLLPNSLSCIEQDGQGLGCSSAVGGICEALDLIPSTTERRKKRRKRKGEGGKRRHGGMEKMLNKALGWMEG